MTATARVLAFAAAPHAIPVAVRETALGLLADTLAVGIAGSTAPGADGVLAAARAWGALAPGGAVPAAAVLGRGPEVQLPSASAAFVNAFQIHCLEWDAVHEPAVVHAMSVVTAALHAACQPRSVPGPDLAVVTVAHETALTALCVGVDIACGLGLAATGPLKFFRPATAGLIGAALACARVRGIAADRFDDVLGLAYGQCAGTMQAHVEGSVGLPLQIAHAARAAVTAVDLVAQGLTGPHDALEGPFGYFRLFDDGNLDSYAATLGQDWRIGEISVKPWPSGRASHATLGVLDGLRAEQVVAIEAHVPPLILRLVGRPWRDDMPPAYARLCLPFLSALMLTDGRIDPRRFGEASFGDPVLRDVGDRLTLIDDLNPDPNALSPQRFVVTLTDGSRIERSVPATLGHPAAPLTSAQAGAKRSFALSLAAVPTDLTDPLTMLTGAP